MKFIANVDDNWGIGRGGRLLVRISEDQKFFKRTTMGHVVILGRKTLEEFPGGRPLAGRTNIILSSNREYEVDGAVVVHSFDELFDELEKYDTDDVYVIGGQSVYRELIPYCDTGIITRTEGSYDADAHIVNLDEDPDWYVADETWGEDLSRYRFRFVTYRRKSKCTGDGNI